MVVWWCGWRWRHVNQTLEGGEGSILKAEMKVRMVLQEVNTKGSKARGGWWVYPIFPNNLAFLG